jgi:hypothetical protein
MLKEETILTGTTNELLEHFNSFITPENILLSNEDEWGIPKQLERANADNKGFGMVFYKVIEGAPPGMDLKDYYHAGPEVKAGISIHIIKQFVFIRDEVSNPLLKL